MKGYVVEMMLSLEQKQVASGRFGASTRHVTGSTRDHVTRSRPWDMLRNQSYHSSPRPYPKSEHGRRRRRPLARHTAHRPTHGSTFIPSNRSLLSTSSSLIPRLSSCPAKSFFF